MTRQRQEFLWALAILLVGVGVVLLVSRSRSAQAPEDASVPVETVQGVATNSNAVSSTRPPPSEGASDLVWPIDQVEERISKKPFGLKVSPTQSPVSPERFSGFHTGVDFETFSEEAEREVPVRALCSGKLLLKRAATGYGGVAVQACTVKGQAVTVVYGHLKLSSLSQRVGEELTQGEVFAVLGQGNSTETGGERKHLHVGIHRGTAVDLRGYVSQEAELDAWVDMRAFFEEER